METDDNGNDVAGEPTGLTAGGEAQTICGFIEARKPDSGGLVDVDQYAFTVAAAGELLIRVDSAHGRDVALITADAALAAGGNGSDRGHGIRGWRLDLRYILTIAANPLISLAGLSIAALLSASLLIEVVMSWPGLGPLLVEALLARDVHVVLGASMLATVFLVSGNLLADLALCAVDPRIRA